MVGGAALDGLAYYLTGQIVRLILELLVGYLDFKSLLMVQLAVKHLQKVFSRLCRGKARNSLKQVHLAFFDLFGLGCLFFYVFKFFLNLFLFLF